MQKKRVFRIVTSNYCIPAHLDNTLRRIPSDYELYVFGDKATDYSDKYPNVIFIDLPIKRSVSLVNDFISFVLLIYYLIKIRPHVVHSLMTKAGLFAAITSIITFRPKRIHTFTGQVWANETGIKRYLLILIDIIICKLNTHCLTDSPSQSRFLFDNGVKFKGSLVPCLFKGSLSGVDLNRMNSKTLNESSRKFHIELGIGENDQVIGYVARKSIDKGCMEMLSIFKKLYIKNKKVKLLFIGPDESGGKIDQFLIKNPEVSNQIIHLGFVHNHESYLNLCKILCLPSFREGFGSIIVDAAALGIPSIGYSIPGLIDSIFDKHSGFLINLGDQENFVEKILLLLNDNVIYSELSKNAKNIVKTFFDADMLNDALYKTYYI